MDIIEQIVISLESSHKVHLKIQHQTQLNILHLSQALIMFQTGMGVTAVTRAIYCRHLTLYHLQCQFQKSYSIRDRLCVTKVTYQGLFVYVTYPDWLPQATPTTNDQNLTGKITVSARMNNS